MDLFMKYVREAIVLIEIIKEGKGTIVSERRLPFMYMVYNIIYDKSMIGDETGQFKIEYYLNPSTRYYTLSVII